MIDLTIWLERGHMAARGNVDAANRGAIIAVAPGSTEDRALLESWLRESGEWQKTLDSMPVAERVEADGAAWRGYCEEQLTLGAVPRGHRSGIDCPCSLCVGMWGAGKVTPPPALCDLAEAVVYPLQAGSQGVITIDALGGSWEPNRRIRVSRAHGPQQEEDDSFAWEGTITEWGDAVRAAAARSGQ